MYIVAAQPGELDVANRIDTTSICLNIRGFMPAIQWPI